MASIIEMIGTKRGMDMTKKYPCITRYVEKFYDSKDFLFNFEANDLMQTASMNGLNYCHVQRHIIEDLTEAKKFARNKIEEAFASIRDKETSSNGTFEPTWFDSKEDASLLLEEFLLTESFADKKAKLEQWAADMDINHSDFKNRRMALTITYNEVTGHGMAGGTSYDNIFECHGVRLVAEYVVDAGCGNFAFYDAYPCYTKEDRVVIDKAKLAWREMKAARKR